MIIYEVHINHEHRLFPSYILMTSGNIARYNLSLMNHVYIWKIQFHMAGGKEDRPSLLFSLIHFFFLKQFQSYRSHCWSHNNVNGDLLHFLLFIYFILYKHIYIYILEGGGDSLMMYLLFVAVVYWPRQPGLRWTSLLSITLYTDWMCTLSNTFIRLGRINQHYYQLLHKWWQYSTLFDFT